MRTINSLAELQIGVGLVYLKDGNAEYYEVVMHHPVQERTFVLMRKPDMKLISVHIATLIGRSAWRIDFSQKDVLDYEINYYEQMAKTLREIRNDLTEQDEKENANEKEL
jgi:hypothetical protein